MYYSTFFRKKIGKIAQKIFILRQFCKFRRKFRAPVRFLRFSATQAAACFSSRARRATRKSRKAKLCENRAEKKPRSLHDRRDRGALRLSGRILFYAAFQKNHGRAARKMAITNTSFFPEAETYPVYETAFAIFFDERRFYPISFYPIIFYPIISLRYISAYP